MKIFGTVLALKALAGKAFLTPKPTGAPSLEKQMNLPIALLLALSPATAMASTLGCHVMGLMDGPIYQIDYAVSDGRMVPSQVCEISYIEGGGPTTVSVFGNVSASQHQQLPLGRLIAKNNKGDGLLILLDSLEASSGSIYGELLSFSAAYPASTDSFDRIECSVEERPTPCGSVKQ